MATTLTCADWWGTEEQPSSAFATDNPICIRSASAKALMNPPSAARATVTNWLSADAWTTGTVRTARRVFCSRCSSGCPKGACAARRIMGGRRAGRTVQAERQGVPPHRAGLSFEIARPASFARARARWRRSLRGVQMGGSSLRKRKDTIYRRMDGEHPPARDAALARTCCGAFSTCGRKTRREEGGVPHHGGWIVSRVLSAPGSPKADRTLDLGTATARSCRQPRSLPRASARLPGDHPARLRYVLP